ncbi:hypothetical protein ACHAPE_007087 [Trichoderma viride]
MHPSHYSSDDSEFSDTSSDLDMNTLQQRPQRTEDRSKTIARHIAIHLQVLMLLTLRFAALQKEDNDLVDDDLKSDDVDIDEENSSSESNDSDNLSDINSRRDVVTGDIDDKDGSGAAKDLDNDMVEDNISVPDTDFSLDDIPKQYDGLVAENDDFLKKVIESGAWQSWQDGPNKPIRRGSGNYTVAWICATSTEYTAAVAFLDDVHKGSEDRYTLGQIGRHNVIIATIAGYGPSYVPKVADYILQRFGTIRFCLLVGIGGGAPSAKHDIRLGDVVVGYSSSSRGGAIIQYDFRRTVQVQKLIRSGVLNRPPTFFEAAINALQSRYEKEGHMLKEAIDTTLNKNQSLRESYKRPDTDRLYRSQFVHPSKNETDCAVICGDDPLSFIQRPKRVDDAEDDPTVHYGSIVSARNPMKDALLRDKLSEQEDILCFETEAAEVMERLPCVVIRGICDYSDSHYNESWQAYAAISAAACARDLLSLISPREVEAEKIVAASGES